MKQTAVEFYTERRGNCAQAIVAAWCAKSGDAAFNVASFSMMGHGKAPDGLCGALYAACTIAGEENSASVRIRFTDHAGERVSCRDIRAAGIMSCVECVSLAADILENQILRQNQMHARKEN